MTLEYILATARKRLLFCLPFCLLLFFLLHTEGLATAQTTQPANAAPPLARLFHTPEKRRALDHQREQIKASPQETAENTRLTLNGVLLRSNGSRSLWINDARAEGTPLPDNIVITPQCRRAPRLLITHPQRPPIQARVGDMLDGATGNITPLLSPGSISLNRANGRHH